MSTYLHWFKSSYSGSEGECVEVAVQRFTSSYSGDQGNYMEIAKAPITIHVRDSKDTTHPGLALSPTAWAAFTHAATRAGMTGPYNLT